MVHMKMMTKVTPSAQELPYTHISRTFALTASTVENFPRLAKAVMEHLHRLCHSSVGISVRSTERRQRYDIGWLCFRHD